MTSVDKFLMSLWPAIAMAVAYMGWDISPEWYEALVATVSPGLVWAFPNRPSPKTQHGGGGGP